MLDLLVIVFPVFALIALGYGLIMSGLIEKDVGSALSKFVFTVPLPLLLFRALATADIGGQSPWALWFSYFFCLFTMWALGMVVVRFVFGRKGSVLAVAGVSASFSNLVLLAIPLVASIYGDDALFPLLMVITLHLPLVMLASSLFVEWYGKEKGESLNLAGALANVGRGLIRNPLIIGIVAGGLWNLTGLPIPSMASLVIDKIVPVTVPLALIAMGMGMRDYGLRGDIIPGLTLALMKVMVFPALFLLVTHTILPLPPEWVAIAILGASSPTGVNAYLLANHFNVGHRLSANTITLSVLMALVTFPFWISVSHQIAGK